MAEQENFVTSSEQPADNQAEYKYEVHGKDGIVHRFRSSQDKDDFLESQRDS